MADAYRESEQQHVTREKAIQANAEREIEAARRRSEDHADYQIEANRTRLQDKDEYWSQRLREQVMDAHERQRDLQLAFKQSQDQHEKMQEKQSENFDKRIITNAENLNEAKNKALSQQAKAYQDAMARDRKQMGQEIDMLQKHLHRINTDTEIADISPAAEQAVRNMLQKEYEARAGSETERNQRTLESMRQNNADKIRDIVDEKDFQNEQRQRIATGERHRERGDLLNAIAETEQAKATALRDQDQFNEREKQKLVRTYVQQMQTQKRHVDELLDQTRDTAATAMRQLKQENDFNTKMAQRNAAARESEITRNYEKRLADQKQDFMNLVNETKSSAEMAARDVERKHKTQMDDLTRSYEQRIAQTQQQNQERERTVAASYEDQIERIKRSNDMLARRKQV
jgi:hypothetical protein